MPSATAASSGSPATDLVKSTAGATRVLTRLAVAGIASSILIMIAMSLVRDSWMYPPMAGTGAAPPWDLRSLHVSAGVATVALWVAVLAGAGGVAAGLVAVQRGARPSLRALLVAAALAVVTLAVLPPAGSSDVFDYAAYGRIMALGHNPYLMTPSRLRLAHNAFAQSVPVTWQHVVSVYGPLATVEQFLAAKLGGVSAARVVFWLKAWDAIAFGAVAFVADRLLRSDPARRLRAHLLWTINPLLLWDIVAAGHLDVLAAAVGLVGLLALGEQADGARPGLARVLAAGALIGVAADIKINYALFGLGLAWALPPRPRRGSRWSRRATSASGCPLSGPWPTAGTGSARTPSTGCSASLRTGNLTSRRSRPSWSRRRRCWPSGACRPEPRPVRPSGRRWLSRPPGCSSGPISSPGTT